MYMNPIVAMIGSTFPFAMTSPITSPHSAPIPIAITKSRNAFSTMLYFSSIPTVIPENASVDAIEISMPPSSSTPSIPSVMIMITALFFSISDIDFSVMNEGLLNEMTTQRIIKTIRRLASREPVIFFQIDSFSFIFPISSYFDFSIASSRIPSWVASSRFSSPVTFPPHITTILSLMPRISGISEEIRIIAYPSFARSPMI